MLSLKLVDLLSIMLSENVDVNFVVILLNNINYKNIIKYNGRTR